MEGVVWRKVVVCRRTLVDAPNKPFILKDFVFGRTNVGDAEDSTSIPSNLVICQHTALLTVSHK